MDARFLKQQQTTIGWVYDAALRAELTARLGADWRPNKEGRLVDLAAVLEDRCTLFSERSAQVAAKLHELIARWSVENDGDDPDPHTIAKLERRAVTASRPPESRGIEAATPHDEWIEQAIVNGFDPAGLTHRRLTGHTAPSDLDDDAFVVEPLRLVQDESATWLRADIARHLTNLVPPSAAQSAAALVARIDRLAALAEKRCIQVGPALDGPSCRDGRPIAEGVTDHRFTTIIMLSFVPLTGYGGQISLAHRGARPGVAAAAVGRSERHIG